MNTCKCKDEGNRQWSGAADMLYCNGCNSEVIDNHIGDREQQILDLRVEMCDSVIKLLETFNNKRQLVAFDILKAQIDKMTELSIGKLPF